MKKYILAITTGLLVIFGISMIYGLKPVCVIITGLVSISVIPGIIRKRYYNNNRLKKFMDVDIYLHQMAYSFMRNPKIYTALVDLDGTIIKEKAFSAQKRSAAWISANWKPLCIP